MKKVFFIVFTAYFGLWFILFKLGVNSLPIQSEDTVPAMFLPYAIIENRTLYLTDYYDQMVERYPHPDDRSYEKGMTPFYLKKIGNEFASAFTLITPILALPVYLFPILFNIPPTWDVLIVLSHLSSAVLMALSASLMFYLLNTFLVKDKKNAELLTFIYAFGTVNFAMLSQSLWQHGIVELLAILQLIVLYKYFNFNGYKFVVLLGFLSGITFLTRPTAILISGFIFLALIINAYIKTNKLNLKLFGYYFLGLLVPALFFWWYNSTYYVDISNQGYASQLFEGWLGNFPESFAGIWLSPSKGILVFTPVFIFSFVGLYLALKKGIKENYIYLIFALIVLAHTLVMSFWKHWYGGFSFGYRMSSEIIPFLVLLLVPFVQSASFNKYKKVFVVFVVISVLIELYGMVFFDGIWHNAYDKGFTDTSWLWSLKDSEFAFNIRRLMVKFGMMDRACPQCLPGYET